MGLQKIDALDVLRIRVLYADNTSVLDISERFHLSPSYIGEIVRGARYPDAPGPITRRRHPVHRTHETMQAAEIRLLYEQGMRQVDIAAKYDLSQNAVSDIIQHKARCPQTTRRRTNHERAEAHPQEDRTQGAA